MTSSDPQLLQIAPRFAAQPTGGAELRNYHLAERLSRHMRVTHVGFPPAGSAAADRSGDSRVCFVPVPRHGSDRPLDLVRGAIGKVPFSILNYTRQEMIETLRRLMSETRFDIVQLESIHLAGYLPVIQSATNTPRLLVCDWHNIESEILQRYGDTTSSWPKRIYAHRAARQLAKYERWFVQQCDLHIAVSDRDAETLRQYGARQVTVIENGVDTGQFATAHPDAKPSERRRIVFVGAMDYHANIDAAISFAREVWPQVSGRLPGLTFTIVGRKPADAVRALAKMERVEVTGTVQDVRPYYREALMAVVPLRVGGGTRLKILEAMAGGVPVVSTSLGAEGLKAAPNREYLLADTSDAMAQAVLRLAGDSVEWARIVEAGRQLVKQQYDWAALGDRCATRLLELLQSSSR